jgi:hypothetical protein
MGRPGNREMAVKKENGERQYPPKIMGNTGGAGDEITVNRTGLIGPVRYPPVGNFSKLTSTHSMKGPKP